MNKISRLLAAHILMLSLLLGSFVGLAEAHVLKENNGISAFLHMPPADSPIAGQPTRMELSFTGETHDFSLQDCDCQLLITQGSRTLQTVTLLPASADTSLDSVVTPQFPAVGAYDVIVKGTPKDGRFQAFQLKYPVRVTLTASEVKQADDKAGVIAVIGVGGLLVIGMVVFATTKNRRHPR